MKLTETLKSLGRRWYVVVLGLALTLGMGMVIDAKVPTTYQATGSILLMPPEATVGIKGNPYLWLGGLNTALDVVVRRASAVEVSGAILNQYPGAELIVNPDRTTSSAIILVNAEAASGDTALQLRDAGMASVLKTLSVMQDESAVKEDLRIHAEELVVDKKAAPKTKTRLQLLIITAGGGFVGTLFLASLIDGWAMDRRQRKRAVAQVPVSPEPATAHEFIATDLQGTNHTPHQSRETVTSREAAKGVLALQNSSAVDVASTGTPLKVP